MLRTCRKAPWVPAPIFWGPQQGAWEVSRLGYDHGQEYQESGNQKES